MSLFGGWWKPKIRESTHHILDGDMRFECTLEYANRGYEEGWLELVNYWIDHWETEHCEYRHVPRT